MWLIILLYALFAFTFIFAKAVLAYVTPFYFIALRMMVAGAALLLYLSLSGRETLKLEMRGGFRFQEKDDNAREEKSWLWLQKHRLYWIYIAFFHIILPYNSEFWALQYVSAAKAALIYNFSPFITALIAVFLQHERLTRYKSIGLLFGFLGVIPWIYSMTSFENLSWNISYLSLPEIALFISVASSAYGWVLFKDAITVHGYSSLLVNGRAMLYGGVATLLWCGLLQYNLFVPNTNHQTAVGMLIVYMVLLIITANIICYNLYGYLLRFYSATFLSLMGFLCPLFTALIGIVWFGEAISLSLILSILLFTLGVAIFYREEQKKKLQG